MSAAAFPVASRLGIVTMLGSGALLLGAYYFQYVVKLAPCELCYWQRYPHMVAVLTRRGTFFTLVYMVFGAFLFFAAPIPMLFTFFNLFVLLGVARYVLKERRARRALAKGGPARPVPEERG